MKITNDMIIEAPPKNMVEVKEKTVDNRTELESEIVEVLEENNIPADEEKIQEIKTFINENNIPLDKAKEVLEYLVDKKIAITSKNLICVFHALNKEFNVNINPEKKEIHFFKLPSTVKNKVQTMKIEQEPNVEILKEISKDRLVEILKASLKIKEEEKVEPSRKENIDSTSFIDDIMKELLEEVEDVAKEIAPVITEDFFVKMPPVKKVIHVEVTEKMAKLENLFQIEKKSVLSLIKEPEKVSMTTLAAAIDKLDHIILKSDITLYTDMKTEKDLLHSSSELEIARNLLDNDRKEAIKIITRVHKKIQSLSYKPSKQRMMLQAKKAVYHSFYNENMIDFMPERSSLKGARNILELLRSLGLNHEYEVTEKLYDKKSSVSEFNIKKILLELKESGEKVQTKDALDNLTGQQLINKLEHKSVKQRLLFNIPIEIHHEIKNLKLHVNARKEHEKIDWKNSRLYFAVNLTNIGDTGILVDVFDRKVNITIKNDNIKEEVLNNLEDIKNNLNYIGYKINNITCSKLTHKANMKGVRLEL